MRSKTHILIVILFIIAVVSSYFIGKATNKFNKPSFSFTDDNNGAIDIYGSFVVKDQYGNILQGKNDPTAVSGHTVDVYCDQNAMTCIEKQAFIGPITNSIVIGNSKQYEVDQWTDNTIVSKPLSVDACTTEILTVDRASKTVLVANKLSNTNGSCVSLPSSPLTLTIQ